MLPKSSKPGHNPVRNERLERRWRVEEVAEWLSAAAGEPITGRQYYNVEIGISPLNSAMRRALPVVFEKPLEKLIAPENLDRTYRPTRGQRDPYVRLEEYVKRIVDEAPPLTDEQRDRIAKLLKGGS